MPLFARPRQTSTGLSPTRRTGKGRSKRERPRGCTAIGAQPGAPGCTRALGRERCNGIARVALAGRRARRFSCSARRDNATVHPSITRRRDRVVPGSTRSRTRRVPGAHEGNTQGTGGSRPGNARVGPHRLHVQRTFSSLWRHGPCFAPRLAFRARRSPGTTAYHVQLSTNWR